MGKRWDRATSEDIRQTSLERLPENRSESTQVETRSNDLRALDEIVEVYRQHTRLKFEDFITPTKNQIVSVLICFVSTNGLLLPKKLFLAESNFSGGSDRTPLFASP